MTTRKEVIETTGNRVVVRKVADDGSVARVEDVYYPLPGYGNYEKTVIEMNSVERTVEIFIVRDGWNGTGRTDLGWIRLSDEEFNELFSKMMTVQSLYDFEDVRHYVLRLIESREEETDSIMNSLIDTLLSLVKCEQEKEILERFKDEELKELAREFIEEKLESALDDC